MNEALSSASAVLGRVGCVALPSGLRADEIEELRSAVEDAAATAGRGGRRLRLESLPTSLVALPRFDCWQALIEGAVGGPARIVRALLFDKSDRARWRVGWHRDTVVPLAEARAVGGFTAPSLKAGQPHAQAPRSVLETMLALRLHLDEADERNGCLLVVPGSHRDDAVPIPPPPERVEPRVALAGEALLMRPLLLHASAKPQSGARRRVLHLDLVGPGRLPGDLEWPHASDASALDI